MQKEIGGYIEFERYSRPMLHEGAIALNSARNALAYLIRTKKIRKIWIPFFLCDSVRGVCERENVSYEFYSIDKKFMPGNIDCEADDWIYVVNYYGQLSNQTIKKLKEEHDQIIVDNVQAYFQEPVTGIDTLYTCRKFFGVPDGAFLYTDTVLQEEIPQDESFKKMQYLMGRFERTASEFYSEYVAHEKTVENEPIKRMSKLTENLLRGIDYEAVKQKRTENFKMLHKEFEEKNRLRLIVPEGAFMYPLYLENGFEIRKKLQQEKIYIPTLWPDVFERCEENAMEYNFAKNILPLPVDQRYGGKEVEIIIDQIWRKMQ